MKTLLSAVIQSQAHMGKDWNSQNQNVKQEFMDQNNHRISTEKMVFVAKKHSFLTRHLGKSFMQKATHIILGLEEIVMDIKQEMCTWR